MFLHQFTKIRWRYVFISNRGHSCSTYISLCMKRLIVARHWMIIPQICESFNLCIYTLNTIKKKSCLFQDFWSNHVEWHVIEIWFWLMDVHEGPVVQSISLDWALCLSVLLKCFALSSVHCYAIHSLWSKDFTDNSHVQGCLHVLSFLCTM